MKRNYIFLLLLFAFWFMEPAILKAQSKIDKDFKEKSVIKIDKLLQDFYVFPEVAKTTGTHLKKQLKKGAFDKFNDLESFSNALTQEVQSINKDKHMRIMPMPVRAGRGQAPTQDDQIDFMLRHLKSPKEATAGFVEAKKIKGNIGYVDLRSFPPVSEGAPVADAYMRLFQNADAIIVDLRKNGGGSPEMVQYLCSYFFDKDVHLNSIYNRLDNKTTDYRTLAKVNGKKLPDVPLFILTSNKTFSGAEEFAYNMQTQKRATLIGETTGGGANPGGMHPVNEQMGIFIPDGTAINPVTKKNWEGVGVIPEVATTAESAFDKGLELAGKAAEENRQAKYTAAKSLLKELFTNLDKVSAAPAFNEQQLNEITALFRKCVDKGLLNEGEINMMGYNALGENKTSRAELILKANTLLFPNSPNVYDSYAEALAKSNKPDLALLTYQKAVDTASINNDPQIQMYKDNLSKFKEKAPSKSK